MKAKLLLMLFLVSLSLGILASGHSKKKPHARCEVQNDNIKSRDVFIPSVFAEDANDCLYLIFQFSLSDADITIRDKEGNEVVNDQQTVIYEGRVITIPQSDGYPYSIVITSSTVNIQGEIVLED